MKCLSHTDVLNPKFIPIMVQSIQKFLLRRQRDNMEVNDER